MMISNEKIQANKETFIGLLSSIEREGFKKELLLNKLENSDFYTAPASTKYHGSYKGGLVEHCLNVYNNLHYLVNFKGLNEEISEESIKIVALLHDLSKRNYYKTAYRNVKVYSENGSKSDEGGRFDWQTVSSYETVPSEEKFLYGNHEETSEYMVRQFIPLKVEESVAILYHMGGMSYDSVAGNVHVQMYGRYPLAVLLHIADMMASYVDNT